MMATDLCYAYCEVLSIQERWGPETAKKIMAELATCKAIMIERNDGVIECITPKARVYELVARLNEEADLLANNKTPCNG